jgi:hypothetical protein
MTLEEMMKLDLDDLTTRFTVYLRTTGIKQSTIDTRSSEFSYIWKKGSKLEFWGALMDAEFPKRARADIRELLLANSNGNVDKNTPSYMSHLNSFKKFVDLCVAESKETNVRVAMDDGEIPRPNDVLVKSYLKRWSTLDSYSSQERALDKLFYELTPQNKDLSDILLKVATLNEFYSTNIKSIYPVAKRILDLDIDARLCAGDESLVDDIARVVYKDKEVRNYSFATKYCSHHNALVFPIYDSYVDRVLRYFRDEDHFADFKTTELKHYPTFKQVLLEFQKFYGLQSFNLKQLDQFVWQFGKDYFPKRYKGSKA